MLLLVVVVVLHVRGRGSLGSEGQWQGVPMNFLALPSVVVDVDVGDGLEGMSLDCC